MRWTDAGPKPPNNSRQVTEQGDKTRMSLLPLRKHLFGIALGERLFLVKATGPWQGLAGIGGTRGPRSDAFGLRTRGA